MTPKEIKTVKKAIEQLTELRAYASDVRSIELANIMGKKSKKKAVPVMDLDSLDDAWMAALDLDKIIKGHRKVA